MKDDQLKKSIMEGFSDHHDTFLNPDGTPAKGIGGKLDKVVTALYEGGDQQRKNIKSTVDEAWQEYRQKQPPKAEDE